MTRITAPWLTSEPAQKICRVLADGGYKAWFVGGCVRNSLLDEPVADIDVTTDAHPDAVVALGQAADLRVVPTGIDHGTVTVVIHGVPFEVTTLRRDVATHGRRATVAFADNITDDARRRDFTMNALYAGADGIIVDPLGGMADLLARRVRFIEDADQRIKEDYLRILRFFRFHAWYGLAENGLDQEALAACAANIDGLETLSAERVTHELLRLLAAPDPAPSVAAFAATGGLARILPGASATQLAVLVHIEQAAGLLPDPIRRLAALGGEAASNLRLSRQQATHLGHITSATDLRELAYRQGEKVAMDQQALHAASIGAELHQKTCAIIAHAAAQTFPLKATDLMPGLQGPALGKALKHAEARWIASDFTLTKADLLA
jgi:poly(A) polymerase